MKICVFCPFSLNGLTELVDLTMPNKRKYCDRHGYDLLTPPLPGTGSNHEEMYGFKRMPLVAELLRSDAYDWIWVVGLDVLVTNHSIALESITDDGYGMVVGADVTGVGMDSYLIQKKMGGLEFIELVAMFAKSPIGPGQDQSTIDHLCAQDPALATVIKLIPQRKLNAYRYASLSQYAFISQGFVTGTDALGNSGEWQPGDFVLHTPGIRLDQKLVLLREAIPSIQE